MKPFCPKILLSFGMEHKKGIANRTPWYFCLHHGFYKFLSIFGPFFLLCGLVSHIFTIFVRDSEVCLERCDSYGNFGYLKKKKKKIILREFSKRTHCPPIVTLFLLLFVSQIHIAPYSDVCLLLFS